MPPEHWEIWLDVNLSPIIAKWMADYTGFTVKSSYLLGYQMLTDYAIYQKAKIAGNVILISKDTDFPEIINRLGSPPKLISIKIGNCDNRTLWKFLLQHINNALQILLESDTNIVEIE